MKVFIRTARACIGVFLCLILLTSYLLAQQNTYRTQEEILYRDAGELTDYMQERCRLDLYYPAGQEGFASIVWFHGGGLRAGNKFIPKELQAQGVAVVAVNYRLSPKIKTPAFIKDAAAAVAWTFKHIAEYGGNPNKIFVSGHSAGGYLASMVGLDKSWLAAHDIDADQIAGLIPYSGHTITHFTIRGERDIPGTQAIVDEYAPLYFVRADAPPFLMITGDRELELLGRYEENAYMWRMMKVAGHPQCEILELDGYDHGGMAVPAHPLLLKFVRKILKEREE